MSSRPASPDVLPASQGQHGCPLTGNLFRWRFTAHCQWRGRTVAVHWDDAKLAGDPDFVAYLWSQCGEPIALELDGKVLEVSFDTKDVALLSLLKTTGYLVSLDGDIDDDDLAGFLRP